VFYGVNQPPWSARRVHDPVPVGSLVYTGRCGLSRPSVVPATCAARCPADSQDVRPEASGRSGLRAHEFR